MGLVGDGLVGDGLVGDSAGVLHPKAVIKIREAANEAVLKMRFKKENSKKSPFKAFINELLLAV